jgi:hypothetical protein
VVSDGWPFKDSGQATEGLARQEYAARFPSGGSWKVTVEDGYCGGVGGFVISGWYYFGNVNCHDNTNSDGWPQNQLWNNVTPW